MREPVAQRRLIKRSNFLEETMNFRDFQSSSGEKGFTQLNDRFYELLGVNLR